VRAASQRRCDGLRLAAMARLAALLLALCVAACSAKHLVFITVSSSVRAPTVVRLVKQQVAATA
jgi:hypothetical protein